MTIERTEQGLQHVLEGAERLTDRQLAERRMVARTKTTKPQKSFESTPLFGGLAPHQDSLF
jgi:hypothetical protein